MLWTNDVGVYECQCASLGTGFSRCRGLRQTDKLAYFNLFALPVSTADLASPNNYSIKTGGSGPISFWSHQSIVSNFSIMALTTTIWG
jgi:hypothetical protein